MANKKRDKKRIPTVTRSVDQDLDSLPSSDNLVDDNDDGTSSVAPSEASSAETNLSSGMASVSLLEADGCILPASSRVAVSRELAKFRSSTGSLISQPRSNDIQIGSFSVQLYGRELVIDTTLRLNYGRRYGLIGENGCGKSTLLDVIGNREVPIPSHVNIFHLKEEYPATDLTAIDAVVQDAEREAAWLELEAEKVLDEEGPDSELLQNLYERIDELNVDRARASAGEILHGLGFTTAMQRMKTREFSGGWRMRVSLARALLVRPHLLLLDSPTSHLDLEAVVWLEEYLRTYDRILVVVSHSQDFMNQVCTNIMHLENQKLKYYGGNYDTFARTREELLTHQEKNYKREQHQIAHIQHYIDKYGHGAANLASQAKSREKLLEKMQTRGLTEKVQQQSTINFKFPDCGRALSLPVLMVSDVAFGYPNSEKGLLYTDLNLAIDMDTRAAIVGPNGFGKSTLLKLLMGDLQPNTGRVVRHHHLRCARFHQHMTEQLDPELNPMEYMLKEFPQDLHKDNVRSAIGRFGITGLAQSMPIKFLSDGQKARLAFATIAVKPFQIAFFDEPSNALSIETIDALAAAINAYAGGVVIVSHDFRLIEQVAKEIWVCEDKTIRKYDGSIRDYKRTIRRKLGIPDREEE